MLRVSFRERKNRLERQKELEKERQEKLKQQRLIEERKEQLKQELKLKQQKQHTSPNKGEDDSELHYIMPTHTHNTTPHYRAGTNVEICLRTLANGIFEAFSVSF